MYKLGFRTIEEVAEADPSELAAIPGVGSQELIASIQQAAEDAQEKYRQAQIRLLTFREKPITERERMLFISGIGERTIELLAEAGYNTVESLAVEADSDRLVISTGLGIQKARRIVENAQVFLDSEEIILEEIRKEAEKEREEQELLNAALAEEEAELAEESVNEEASAPEDNVEDKASEEVVGEEISTTSEDNVEESANDETGGEEEEQ
jgi:Holliday junction resolvasome RuvABC DNA-binding subunit